MENKVFLLKLLNGDEIFGQIASFVDGDIIVNDPMTAESRVLSDGNSAMVINRYLPMVKTNSVNFKAAHVICMNEVSEALEEYYNLSVEYAKRSDKKLDDNIRQASTYMRKVLKDRESVKRVVKELIETDDDEDSIKDEVYKYVLSSMKNTNGSFH